MKKVFLLFALVAVLGLILAACGSKGEEEVVGDLAERLNTLDSYNAEAHLILQTGEEPQEYEVEVWHQQPDFYRIGITNREREITQIILRNEEGVFVLTPHLNKSFRFQSGWPENHGQVYLYESLIADILSDTDRVFSTEGDEYVFETEANYPNHTLTSQKVWLSRDLKPTKVHVLDADFNVMVEVHFSNVEFDYSFEDDAFDIERNMQGAHLESLPTMVEEEESQGSFGTFYPSYTPPGVDLVEEEEVQEDERPMVVLRYGGESDFTIIQERPRSRTVNMSTGHPVDLDYTIGAMGDNKLFWTYEGVSFQIYSEDLPEEEMMAIARSMMGQTSK